jgi:fumarylacetoacetate (FAA) hydrolase
VFSGLRAVKTSRVLPLQEEILKLASLKCDRPDGRLIIVSRDLSSAVLANGIAETLQIALERWDVVSHTLQGLYEALNRGEVPAAFPFQASQSAAPLPRAWQWLDGSAFKAHIDLAVKAYQIANSWGERPLMYQGMSHEFLSCSEDVSFPTEEDGIDFEGEFGVITDAVPAGISAADAAKHIRLLVQINDWSLRVIGRDEMNRGFGWVRAKPACSMAPVAITPDELGPAWAGARIHLQLHVLWNEAQFGHANGAEMAFGFDELIAHAAYSRKLCAGTIIGSGTVANTAYHQVGSSCILERRGFEILEHGAARTRFMKHGDRVRMQARTDTGDAPFGTIDQRAVVTGVIGP